MPSDLEKGLKNFGLSEKEAKVYLAALAIGPASAQAIAAKATVNRPTTYITIESLAKRGLFSSFIQGKKRLFAAAPPERLQAIYEAELETVKKKKSAMDSLLRELTRLGRGEDKPGLSVFEGSEGLAAMSKDLSEAALAASRLDGLAGGNGAAASVADALAGLADRGVNVRMLRSDAANGDKKSKGRRLPAKYHLKDAGLTVSGDKIAITSGRGDGWGVILEDQAAAEAIRTLFDLAWPTSEE